MEIHQADPGRAPLLAEIIRKSFADVAARFNLTSANAPTHPSHCTSDWVLEAMDRGLMFYLLKTEKGACACAARERASPEVCYLERLSVIPEMRKRGLGRSLVEHVERETLRDGATRLEIALISEQEDLFQWYEKQGFELIRRKKFPHLPFTVAFMGKDLGPNSAPLQI